MQLITINDVPLELPDEAKDDPKHGKAGLAVIALFNKQRELAEEEAQLTGEGAEVYLRRGRAVRRPPSPLVTASVRDSVRRSFPWPPPLIV